MTATRLEDHDDQRRGGHVLLAVRGGEDVTTHHGAAQILLRMEPDAVVTAP